MLACAQRTVRNRSHADPKKASVLSFHYNILKVSQALSVLIVFIFSSLHKAPTSNRVPLCLQVGDLVEGVVQSIGINAGGSAYGAFVDVGGRTALLHISRVSNERCDDLTMVLAEGDRVKVGVCLYALCAPAFIAFTSCQPPDIPFAVDRHSAAA